LPAAPIWTYCPDIYDFFPDSPEQDVIYKTIFHEFPGNDQIIPGTI
jgi:hypothetical protein